MDIRSVMVVGVALVLACTPAEPAESSGTLATGSTGASGGTDGVSSTGGASVPTTGGPAETTSEGSGEGSSAGDTGSSTGDSTGEPVRPGCGDGVLAAGEVCFERTEQDTFTRSFSQMALADLDGDGWVGGDTLERAHTALTDFYRPDEAAGFNVHVWPVEQPAFALLQCYQNNHPPPWRVMAADGHIVADPQVIPAELYNVKPTRNRRRIHPVEQPAGG